MEIMVFDAWKRRCGNPDLAVPFERWADWLLGEGMACPWGEDCGFARWATRLYRAGDLLHSLGFGRRVRVLRCPVAGCGGRILLGRKRAYLQCPPDFDAVGCSLLDEFCSRRSIG